MTDELTCTDCGASFTPNGFLTERGWVCRDCGTDPDNPNNDTDMPSVHEIKVE